MPVFIGAKRSVLVALVVFAMLAAASPPALASMEQDTTGDPPTEEPTDTADTAPTDEAVPEDTSPDEEGAVPAEPDPPPPPSKEEPITEPVAERPSGPQPTFVPVHRYDVLRELVFPVVGPNRYHAAFGDCRDACTREHHGIDITTRGWKGLPVVAAHDGTVVRVTYDKGNAGCSVRIRGRDRWETRYLHLNTDFPGTDEIGAPCPAPGIEVGTKVVAGQIIGYVGDSGNSETTTPHLHFELRNRSGYPVDPYRSLKEAREIRFEWLPTNAQAATIALTRASWKDAAGSLIVIPTDDVSMMTRKDLGTMVLEAPVIAVDRSDPTAALTEIKRLSPGRIVIMSDDHTAWLEKLLRGQAPIIDTARGPTPLLEPSTLEPDDITPDPFEHNVPDRFVSIIGGAIDRIRGSTRPIYETFIANHKVIVLASDRWAGRGAGQSSMSRPPRNGDRGLVWWLTADGWIGTEPSADGPESGMAYVSERQANIATLNHLAKLAETRPYPLWRS